MSKRLSGLNPLAYMGVEPLSPPAMHQNGRAPTNTDSQGYNLGDFWIVIPPGYDGPEQLFVLVSLNMGQATWAQLYPGSASSTEYQADTGTATPALGIMKVVGDGTTISTAASGNTITISSDSDVADNYVTDSGTATPSSHVLNVVGGININTEGASNTVTVNLNDSVNLDGDLDVGGNTTLVGTLQVSSLSTGVVQSGTFGSISSSKGTNGQLLIGSTAGAPAWANLTSLGGTITITNNANAINLESEGGGGSGDTIVSQFTSSGTWTKNVGTQYMEVYIVCAGGGGASGSTGASGVGSFGGGGAGSWGTMYISGPSFMVDSPQTITIGAGGTGGVGVSTSNTTGNPGGNGSASSFGIFTTAAGENPPGLGNGGGLGGQIYTPGYYGDIGMSQGLYIANNVLQSVAGTGRDRGTGGNNNSSFDGINGFNRSVNSFQPGTSDRNVSVGSYFAAGTGGGGAGHSSDNTVHSGGNGGSVTSVGGLTVLVAGGAGGEEGVTLDGGNGEDGLQVVGIMNLGAGGGGGGNQVVGTRGGNGGDGGFPGGAGGGGGSAINGSTSGSGGDGAAGIVIIVEYT